MALLDALADLYPQNADIRRVISDASLDESRVEFSGNALSVWASVLREARRQNKWGDLILLVASEYPKSKELKEALSEESHPRRITSMAGYGDRYGESRYGSGDSVEARVIRMEEKFSFLEREVQAAKAAAESAKIAADSARTEANLAKIAAESARATISDFRDPRQWWLVIAGLIGGGILFVTIAYLLLQTFGFRG